MQQSIKRACSTACKPQNPLAPCVRNPQRHQSLNQWLQNRHQSSPPPDGGPTPNQIRQFMAGLSVSKLFLISVVALLEVLLWNIARQCKAPICMPPTLHTGLYISFVGHGSVPILGLLQLIAQKKKKSVTQTILRWHSKFPFARFLRKGVVITMNAEANVVVWSRKTLYEILQPWR